ncbi:hypothetical protein UPYG_G00151760 [Umbra pygmaea]|uniref:Proline and serine-rich protein 3 n=1 Tax=Umbra pygmaea TaxID=75934 RepID=A0ABD0WX42_UMBPY
MNSSGAAVFTRKNPFPPDPPLLKTHYNPTPTSNISKEAKNTTLSPVRLAQKSSSSQSKAHSLSPEDQCFLGAPEHLVLGPHPATEGQTSFSESWPSTDLGSFPANTQASQNKNTLRQNPTFLVSAEGEESQDSVLAKYIERFRHGRPQSREERQQMSDMVGEGQQPFWWLSSPLPSSSTPTQTTDKGFSFRNQTVTTLSPVGQFDLDLSAMGMSDSSHCDLGDTELLQLQKKASQLLHRSEHSLSSGSIPISSEGLGCSDLSSPVSIEEPVRRPVIPSLINSTTAMGNLSSAAITTGIITHPVPVDPCVPPTSRPEEDILFQWRLRRKMEQARQWPQSNYVGRQAYKPPTTPGYCKMSARVPELEQNLLHERSRVAPSFTAAPQQTSGLYPDAAAPSPPLVVSSPTISKLEPNTMVPPHMHLLCDVLPCPSQPRNPRPSQQRSPRRRDISRTDRTLKQPGAHSRSTDSSPEGPRSKLESSAPPPSWSETTEEEWSVQRRRTARTKKETVQNTEVERSEKCTRQSLRKKKSSRHQVGAGGLPERPKSVSRRDNTRDPDKATLCMEKPSSDVGQQGRRLGSEGRPGDCAPPPSPIHNVLGQVVSEVLFPTTDCADPPRTPVSLASLRYTPPVPAQSPVPPFSGAQPREVVAQLLKEAEDSDERDFYDDPLLHVLRQQRKWVKEQISEVNSLLNEFQEE